MFKIYGIRRYEHLVLLTILEQAFNNLIKVALFGHFRLVAYLVLRSILLKRSILFSTMVMQVKMAPNKAKIGIFGKT